MTVNMLSVYDSSIIMDMSNQREPFSQSTTCKGSSTSPTNGFSGDRLTIETSMKRVSRTSGIENGSDNHEQGSRSLEVENSDDKGGADCSGTVGSSSPSENDDTVDEAAEHLMYSDHGSEVEDEHSLFCFQERRNSSRSENSMEINSEAQDRGGPKNQTETPSLHANEQESSSLTPTEFWANYFQSKMLDLPSCFNVNPFLVFPCPNQFELPVCDVNGLCFSSSRPPIQIVVYPQVRIFFAGSFLLSALCMQVVVDPVDP